MSLWPGILLTGTAHGPATAALGLGLDASGAGALRTPVTDQSLEEQVRRAFEELRAPVYRYLLSSGGSTAEAEDLIQEAFLRLYRQLHDGHRIDNVRGWIFRVAHNLWIDAGRAGSRHFEQAASETDWRELQASRSDAGPGPEAQMLQRERLERLDEAIRGLTEKQRQSLHLRAEGLSYREIAEVLGVSVSTVVEAVRRCVEKLGKV